ncbi:aldo/keto reductase [Marinifilum sp. JC120]|nr:aldo/keto reductase [Marinifilum sp. JC120]
MILKTLGNSDIKISSIGLGCMGLSEFYGEPASEKQGCDLIRHALDKGVNFFDTADMYGGGHNEKLMAKALLGRRDEAVIATKFGIVREEGEYARTISGKPEYVRKACHESLRRLKTDYIDLYYIHRVDTEIPIEETIGEMSRLVGEGKIRSIGISEASAETLRRAHAVHPLSALQSEYSMLTRDPENEILGLTRELGISFVPYSPICRGLLSNWSPSEDKTDFRNMLPRFQGQAYASNKAIAEALSLIANKLGCTLAQLSLAWVCAQGDNIIPIPGTTKIKNLNSNIDAAQVILDKDDLADIETILTSNKVQGNRYTDEGMKGVNV